MMFASVLVVCLVLTAAAAQSTDNSPACGNDDFFGPSGVISSPNYPGNYYDFLNCRYYINAFTGSSFSIIFKALYTESCCDRITISCPNNASFTPREIYGRTLPIPLSVPWCSRTQIQFVTDGSITYTGFSLDYYVSGGGCGNTVYSGYSGYVTSPNYPSNYGYNQNCTNIIAAPQRGTIYLYFQQFELEGDCSRDWVEINCLDNSDIGSSRYCGYYTGGSKYIYGCSQVFLWFHSDSSYNYQGFNIHYDVYPDAAGTDFSIAETTRLPTFAVTDEGVTAEFPKTTRDNSPVATVTVDQLCGDSYFSDSYGVIRSPNYPGYYYNNLYCDYYVYASTGSTLSFIFKSFHLENADIVTISCSSNSNFPPHEYSGHSSPEPLAIPLCNQARVNFRTDYTNVSSGFSIDYYVSDAGCGSTVYLGSNGHVNSPFWPDGYGYNLNCSNIIWAEEQSTIHLQFRSFNLQDNCSCDWLEISCLDNSEYSPTRYCGNYNSYELFISHCSQVLMWFHSDGSSNYPGYNIEYTVYPDGACGETSYFGPSGVISSPNYPGNYSNFLYCDYTIYAQAGSSFTFLFNSFHVQENSDFVTISCSSNSSYPKNKLTGDAIPAPFSISECSQGLVNLHTDEIVVSSGFSLDYYVSVGGCGNTLYYPTSGYVTSPNWPSNYGYSQDCSNIIQAWDRSTFNLIFQSFILQSCCSCDWLEVSCLDNSDYGPTRYCGSIPPFDANIYNCSRVLLQFHSDGSGNDQGFNIEYNIFANADDSKVPRNRKPNVKENAPSNETPNAAKSALNDEQLNAKDSVPSNGNPNENESAPMDKVSTAEANAPSNGRPHAEESALGSENQDAAKMQSKM